MKIRTGFVSNSSSSSFILILPNDYSKEFLKPLFYNKEQIDLVHKDIQSADKYVIPTDIKSDKFNKFIDNIVEYHSDKGYRSNIESLLRNNPGKSFVIISYDDSCGSPESDIARVFTSRFYSSSCCIYR